MKMRAGWLGAAALWMGAASQAAAQPAKCVAPADAEALIIIMMPDLIGQLNAKCHSTLPDTAFLKQGAMDYADKYRAEAEAAWPGAKRAVSVLGGDEIQPMLDTEMAKSMVPAMMAPIVIGELKTADCPMADRALALIEPLPPRNAAGLFIFFAQIGARTDAESASAFPICPADQS